MSSCSLKNINGTVLVYDKNGEISDLYLNALEYTNNDLQQSLDLYNASDSIEFISETGLNSETATIEDVLSFASNHSISNTSLSSDEIGGVISFMQDNGIKNLNDLSEKLNSLFKNEDGIFEIDKHKLIKSGIYTEKEVDELDAVNILSLVNKITSTSLSNSVNFEIHDIDTNVLPLRNESGNKTIFGTYIGVALNDVLSELVHSGFDGTVDSANSILSKSSTLSGLTNYIDKTSILFKKIKAILNNKISLQRIFITNNGVTNEDISDFKTVLNVIPDVKIHSITADIEFLEGVSEEAWERKEKETESVVKGIEDELLLLNIDVVGLSDKYKDKEGVTMLLESIKQMLQSPSEDNVKLFIDIKSNFLGKKNTSNNAVHNKIKGLDKLKLYHLETALSDGEVFDKYGFVKVADNVYHKPIVDIEKGYSFIYKKFLDGEIKIPKEVFSVDDVYSSENEYAVKNDIKNWVKSRNTGFSSKNQEALSIAQLVFNYPPLVKKQSELSLIKTDVDYLKDGFISDFYQYILEEKRKDSDVYNKVLKHFNISDTDINLNSVLTPDITGIKYEQELRDYASLKKEGQIKELTNGSSNGKNDIDLCAVNNTETVREVDNKDIYQDGDYIVSKNVSDVFIKNNGVLYRQVLKDGVQEKAVYKKVEESSDNIYFDTDINFITNFEKAQSILDKYNFNDEHKTPLSDIADRLNVNISIEGNNNDTLDGDGVFRDIDNELNRLDKDDVSEKEDYELYFRNNDELEVRSQNVDSINAEDLDRLLETLNKSFKGKVDIISDWDSFVDKAQSLNISEKGIDDMRFAFKELRRGRTRIDVAPFNVGGVSRGLRTFFIKNLFEYDSNTARTGSVYFSFDNGLVSGKIRVANHTKADPDARIGSEDSYSIDVYEDGTVNFDIDAIHDNLTSKDISKAITDIQTIMAKVIDNSNVIVNDVKDIFNTDKSLREKKDESYDYLTNKIDMSMLDSNVAPIFIRELVNSINKATVGVDFTKEKYDEIVKEQEGKKDKLIERVRREELLKKQKKEESIFYKKFKNGEITYEEYSNEYRRIYSTDNIDSFKYLKSPNGVVYGAVLSDGTMYLNPETLNANTPIHEHTHLFNQIVQRDNPKLWNRIVEVVKETDEWVEVTNNPAYSNLKTDNEIADEVFAKIVGDVGEGNWKNIIEKNQSKKGLVERIFNSIRDFFNSIRSSLGLNIYKKMDIETMANYTLNEMLNEKPLSKSVREKNVSNLLNRLVSFISKDKSNPLLGGLIIEPRYQSIVGRGMRISDNPNYKYIKKKLGESSAKAIHEFMPNAFANSEKAVEFLKEKIPIKAHIPYILSQAGGFLDREFKNDIKNKNEDYLDIDKDVFELLKSEGYQGFNVDSVEGFMSFRGYYPKDGENGVDVICSYNDPKGRVRDNFVMFVIKDDAKETFRADELTQDNLSPSWKEYLEKNSRKNEDGTYNLDNLKTSLEDPFAKSVISVQLSKEGLTLKTINRYNHTYETAGKNVDNADLAFDGDLDNITKGLNKAFGEYYGVDFNIEKNFNKVFTDGKGRMYHYFNEINGIEYGDGFYRKNGVVTTLDRNSERLVNGFVLNANGAFENVIGKDFPYGNDIKVNNISGNRLSITTENGDFLFDTKNGEIIELLEYSNEDYVLTRLDGVKDTDGNYEIDSFSIGEYPFWNKKIAKIKNDAYFGGSQIQSLGNLRYIGETMDLYKSRIRDLGGLEYIGKDAYFRGSMVQSLGNLAYIGGVANFSGINIQSLDNLQSVGSNIYLNKSIENIGSLRYVGGSIGFDRTQIRDLGGLLYIGGDVDFRDSMVQNLGRLKYILGDAYFNNSQIKDLKDLQFIGKEVYSNPTTHNSLLKIKESSKSIDTVFIIKIAGAHFRFANSITNNEGKTFNDFLPDEYKLEQSQENVHFKSGVSFSFKENGIVKTSNNPFVLGQDNFINNTPSNKMNEIAHFLSLKHGVSIEVIESDYKNELNTKALDWNNNETVLEEALIRSSRANNDLDTKSIAEKAVNNVSIAVMEMRNKGFKNNTIHDLLETLGYDSLVDVNNKDNKVEVLPSYERINTKKDNNFDNFTESITFTIEDLSNIDINELPTDVKQFLYKDLGITFTEEDGTSCAKYGGVTSFNSGGKWRIINDLGKPNFKDGGVWSLVDGDNSF